jgi:hypothetical protein
MILDENLRCILKSHLEFYVISEKSREYGEIFDNISKNGSSIYLKSIVSEQIS